MTAPLAALRRASLAGLARYRPPPPPAEAGSLPFVPDEYTQLYHTPWWERLTPAQRLRYNQLSGLRANELFMLFEAGFTHRVIDRLQGTAARSEPLLGECLGLMLEEERRHHQMFLAFNRALLPAAYADARGHFAPVARGQEILLALVTAAPGRWPLLVWLILLLEEYSTAFSRQLARTPGLDPRFVALHRLHLADEVRHVRLDAALIELLLARLSPRLRRLNAWLFRRLLGELLSPKRSGIRVLRHLAEEFPALAPQLPAMERAVRALGRDPGMAALMDDPARMPITHGLVRGYPGFGWRAG